MPHGTVDPVLLRLRNGGYAFLYSEGTLTELVDVLNRPRLRDKYGLTDADTRTVVGLILLRGEAVNPHRQVRACRDPKDDKFLEVAVTGGADIIASGDQDLLTLSPFEGIPIVTSSVFLARLDEMR